MRGLNPRASRLLFLLPFLIPHPASGQALVGEAWPPVRTALCVVMGHYDPKRCPLPENVLIPSTYPASEVERAPTIYLLGVLQGGDRLLRDLETRMERGPALAIYWGLIEEEREKLKRRYEDTLQRVSKRLPKGQKPQVTLYTAGLPEAAGAKDLFREILFLASPAFPSSVFIYTRYPESWWQLSGSFARQVASILTSGLTYVAQSTQNDQGAKRAEEAPDSQSGGKTGGGP